jgi:hypothetical protein
VDAHSIHAHASGGDGPPAYMFQRYSISPHDDVDTAVEKLQRSAPHLARLLKEAVFRGYPFFSL